jgi:hypothetical protein
MGAGHIFHSPGLLARRCCRLSSNVRLHKMHFRASPILLVAMLRLRSPSPNHLVLWWHRAYSAQFPSKDIKLQSPAERGQSGDRSGSIGFSFGSAANGGDYRNRQFQSQFGPLLSHNTTPLPIPRRAAEDNVALASQIALRKNSSVHFQAQVYISMRPRPIQSLVVCGA